MKPINFTLARLAISSILVALFYCAAPAQSPPVISNQPTGLSVVAGGTATFHVTVAGVGPFRYQWQLNGTNIPDVISTMAGGGSLRLGNGIPAVSARLCVPQGVASDAAGNLFIADTQNELIRKVDARGIITTVAGTGTLGPLRDGGPATNANLYLPDSVAVDGAGNVFVTDWGNGRVRKVDTDGVIKTVAGNGSLFFSGDGPLATNVSLSGPSGVVVDYANNLFIADQGHNLIRRVDANGIIKTVAGGGRFGFGDGGQATNGGLNLPSGIALDSFGNLFIADSGNGRVRKVDTNGTITTVAGGGNGGDGGAATNASLSWPYGLALDSVGNVFVSENMSGRIRKVDINGIITTVTGAGSLFTGDGGPAADARLLYPFGIAIDASGNLLIADSGDDSQANVGHNSIRKVALSDSPTLRLEIVGAADAGDYRVVIGSPYGSVTSAVAKVTLTLPPIQVGFDPGSALRLQFVTVPNTPCILETSSNLIPPVPWRPSMTNLADTNGAWSVVITNVLGYPAQYFRVRAL
jgi:sugar lactone lactonase YvrE